MRAAADGDCRRRLRLGAGPLDRGPARHRRDRVCPQGESGPKPPAAANLERNACVCIFRPHAPSPSTPTLLCRSRARRRRLDCPSLRWRRRPGRPPRASAAWAWRSPRVPSPAPPPPRASAPLRSRWASASTGSPGRRCAGADPRGRTRRSHCADLGGPRPLSFLSERVARMRVLVVTPSPPVDAARSRSSSRWTTSSRTSSRGARAGPQQRGLAPRRAAEGSPPPAGAGWSRQCPGTRGWTRAPKSRSS